LFGNCWNFAACCRFCDNNDLATVLDEVVAQLLDDRRRLTGLNVLVVFANDDALNRLNQNNTASALQSTDKITTIITVDVQRDNKNFQHNDDVTFLP
jgi:hypothetical protein